MCITSTIAGETWNKDSDLWSRHSSLALIHQLQVSTKSSLKTRWHSCSKICPTGWTQVSMRWYFSGPSSFRYHRMWSQGEWGSREGRTGALKHDLLDLAVLELTARASLIPRVIPFGHKLVRNGNVWMTSRHTQRIMKSLAVPSSSPGLLICSLLLRNVSKSSGLNAQRRETTPNSGRRLMDRFVLIRQQRCCCFKRWSTVNGSSLPSILKPWSVFCLGEKEHKEQQGWERSPINYTNAHI